MTIEKNTTSKQNHWKTIDHNGFLTKTIAIPSCSKIFHRQDLQHIFSVLEKESSDLKVFPMCAWSISKLRQNQYMLISARWVLREGLLDVNMLYESRVTCDGLCCFIFPWEVWGAFWAPTSNFWPFIHRTFGNQAVWQRWPLLASSPCHIWNYWQKKTWTFLANKYALLIQVLYGQSCLQTPVAARVGD